MGENQSGNTNDTYYILNACARDLSRKIYSQINTLVSMFNVRRKIM